MTGAALLTLLLAAASAVADEWPHWRGPFHNGTSNETSLISQWSKDGQNLIWRNDFTGRSTPVVFDGKVCANGRVGEELTRQGVVACFDAETGETLWEHKYPIYHTTVPWNRVGWANVTADPESGLLFAQGVHGMFWAFDADTGEIVWSRFLTEEFGFISGYGGRTQTPVVDGDQVLVTFVNSSWGAENAPRHRLRAFDKKTGELLWVSTPGGFPADFNSQSTPAIAVVEGRKLYVQGNGDGHIYALDASTGAKVWDFHLSKRGINSSVTVDGNTVYASHSEENITSPDQGRVVAIDATGSGDVTQTHEKWRADIGAGFPSPALHDGTLYVIDNSADLFALDASTGEIRWEFPLGTVGKSSPAVADGKLFATEVNGRFHIVKLPSGDETEPTALDQDEIEMPSGRYAEIYGSPAIAYGRIYFTTEEGIYSLGNPDADFEVTAGPSFEAQVPSPAEDATADQLRITPAEILLTPGEHVDLEVTGYDAKGRLLPWNRMPRPLPRWQWEGLKGKLIAEPGGGKARFETSADHPHQTGIITAEMGEMKVAARVRVVETIPFTEDFSSYDVGSAPSHWIGAAGKWDVQEEDGEKILVKGPRERGLERQVTYIGSPEASEYTIQADVKSSKTGRRMGDLGLINSGYTLDLRGSLQRLEIRSWEAARRMMESSDYAWEPDTWYTVKLRVEPDGDHALVRGKVWPRGEAEPEAWTLTIRDPVPVRQGSPGLQGYSPTPLFYDNLKVMPNEN